jgi:hypothetical protein
MPAKPVPNFFSAPRRVTDCAILFVSSSNLLFILFVSFVLFLLTTDFTDDTDSCRAFRLCPIENRKSKVAIWLRPHPASKDARYSIAIHGDEGRDKGFA